MKYARLIVVILAARFFVTAVEFPPGDGDLAWQGWLGRTILATHRIPRVLGNDAFSAVGAPWTPQEWLFSIASAFFPWKIFAFAVALCAAIALLLTAYRAARRGAEPIDVALATAAAGMALCDSFGVRAQVVAWPFLALFLLLLDNEGSWVWAAVPVAALWSNVHASAMLAPLLAGAACLGRLWEDRAWTPRVGRIAVVTGACALAICCNPFGVGLPLYAASLFGSPIKAYISEWKPTEVGEYAFSAGGLPLLLGIIVLGAGMLSPRVVLGKRSLRAEDLLIFAASLFLLFFAARNIPIFAIIAAPLFAHTLTRTWVRPSEELPPTKPAQYVETAVSVVAVLLAIFVGHKIFSNPARTEITMPFREADALTAMHGEHRIMCADFAWCSYLVGKPHQHVFLDGRADPYPPKVWNEFGLIAYLRPGWREVLDRYAVNAVIVRRETGIDQALALTGQWKDAASDAKFRLWTRLRAHPVGAASAFKSTSALSERTRSR